MDTKDIIKILASEALRIVSTERIVKGQVERTWDADEYDRVFAQLVMEHEREACAKVCDEQGVGRKALEHYAALTYSGAVHDCAAAIRARGQK